jgi:hypothetical protein
MESLNLPSHDRFKVTNTGVDPVALLDPARSAKDPGNGHSGCWIILPGNSIDFHGQTRFYDPVLSRKAKLWFIPSAANIAIAEF